MAEAGALGAYLTDHMAGSVSASDLARRGAKNNDGPLGTFFSDLVREIDVDRRTLGAIAAHVGVQVNPVKQVLWRTLQTIAGNDQRLADFDFGTLGARAREQLDAVEEQRLRVAASALRG